MRFLPRREGEIKEEVFVKPAKVKNVIPVIDRVGVLDQGKKCSFTMFLFIIFVIKTLQRIMTVVPPTSSPSAQRIKRKRKRRKSLKITLIRKAILARNYQLNY